MSRGRKLMMRVQARVTLVAGTPLVPETIPPGGTLELPKEEAKRLIADGYAVEVPKEDIPASPPPDPTSPNLTATPPGGKGGEEDQSASSGPSSDDGTGSE